MLKHEALTQVLSQLLLLKPCCRYNKKLSGKKYQLFILIKSSILMSIKRYMSFFDTPLESTMIHFVQ